MPRGVKGSGPYSRYNKNGTPKKRAASRPPAKTATTATTRRRNSAANPAEEAQMRQVALRYAVDSTCAIGKSDSKTVLGAADKYYSFLLDGSV